MVWHLWKRGTEEPVTPDPEALEALRVQKIKTQGANARRRQAEPIVAAGRDIWERNHLVDALTAAAHRIVESGK